MPLPTPLISAPALLALLGRGEFWPVVLDCSFDLADSQAGEKAYAHGHLPGARYAHLDRDLSGPKTARGAIDGGRHPLPAREAFAATLTAWGIGPDTPVVAYDAQGGPYAARAWWLLRWLGHSNVAVLDGGLAAWQAAGGPIDRESHRPEPAAAPYPLRAPAMPTVPAERLLAAPAAALVIDARAPERFRGDVEPLDSQAGHIPGARNRFFKNNLATDGRFLPADELRKVFAAFGVPPGNVVHQCGSGVTACHNLLAMEAAGLAGSALYPGSWSEWSSDPARPVARG
ncbi:MAG TPA: sulfurtransferase [Ideonella sp.]|uniref:sulfurtransferase n=1 Tax=Ideonella sp. TaxID=1929293 RepID=UPI002E3574EF|nr:sulfurtransferase [Ideonella sp.]HEX5683066.1 sulfurtransferase [Ideonella sp.]